MNQCFDVFANVVIIMDLLRQYFFWCRPWVTSTNIGLFGVLFSSQVMATWIMEGWYAPHLFGAFNPH